MMTPPKKDSLFWQAPNFLRDSRESVGLSQQELAKMSGVSRAIISDLESGRTYFSSTEHAVKLYMILEASGSSEAAEALQAVLSILKESLQRDLARCDLEIDVLQRQRKARAARLAEIESEEKRLRGKGRRADG